MDGEFSPVRPDGASGRARRQYQRIQAPRVFFSGQTNWAAFSGYSLWLLTKFVWNKFERALLDP